MDTYEMVIGHLHQWVCLSAEMADDCMMTRVDHSRQTVPVENV